MDLRQRQILFALLALLLVFAACKGESPTAPDTGENPPGTPPAGASVSISFSNPNPLTGSPTNVIATVTINGQPAPAGTAVEFGTTRGTFGDTGTNSTLAVTNAQGQATVQLTSTSAGPAVVTAVVNNVVQRADITFTTGPVDPGEPGEAPTITAINPNVAKDSGGETVTITGTNFEEPVRVFFTVNGVQREAQVLSVTPTQIQVLAPAVDLAAGQTATATVTVFVRHGTSDERRVTADDTFTFRRVQLTPQVSGVSPPSGPLEGGTQTTIFGDGFESFVQVFFGLAEAQIIRSDFNSIVVVSPNSRDTTADATPVAGPVPIRIKNVSSGTETTIADAFRYSSAMQIVAVGPTEGPFTGGTRVTIEGVGFDDPVAVTIGGVAAQVIQVTGTKIIALTSGITLTTCGDVTGPISVTNISTGLSAVAGVEFIFRTPTPIIISATSPVQPGGSITVVVSGAFGIPRLRLGDRVLQITSETPSADGSVTTFTATVPTNVALEMAACPGTDVEAPQPTDFDITYESATTGCTDTLEDGVTVEPVPTPRLTFDPGSFTPFTAEFVPGDPAAVPPVPDTIEPSDVQTMNLVNTGSAPLIINSITTDALGGCSAFVISAPPAPQTLNQCEIAPVTVRYIGPTPAARGTQSCTVTVDTNAGTRSFTLTGTTP